MSDYSFMKTGFTNTTQQSLSEDEEFNIISLVNLFGVKAMENAAQYITYCERPGITKEDLVYGMRYEVFEFLNDPDIYKKANKIKDEIIEDDDEDSDWEDIEDLILPDEEITSFTRIDESKINDENRDFINKIHHYYDTWDSWVPQSPLENILKRAIDKANN